MDANATMTNTMMVVMVTSRRVGQVTLPASERTSCRNLNGLNAILSIQVRRETMCDFRESRAADVSPALVGRMSRKTSSIVRGEFNAAPDIRKRAGSRWRVSTAPWGKGQDMGRSETGRAALTFAPDPANFNGLDQTRLGHLVPDCPSLMVRGI